MGRSSLFRGAKGNAVLDVARVPSEFAVSTRESPEKQHMGSGCSTDAAAQVMLDRRRANQALISDVAFRLLHQVVVKVQVE